MGNQFAPAGAVQYFAGKVAPDGWLVADGRAVSRSQYPDLLAVIGVMYGVGDSLTTFNLPDLRGEFIRGWDEGRGVDKDRSFGSRQAGSNIPMAGYINSVAELGIPTGYQDRWAFAGTTFDGGFFANVSPGSTINGTTFPVIETAITKPSTESGKISTWNVLVGTRPRNIALLACIKY